MLNAVGKKMKLSSEPDSKDQFETLTSPFLKNLYIYVN